MARRLLNRGSILNLERFVRGKMDDRDDPVDVCRPAANLDV